MPILDESGFEDREKLFLKYIYAIEFLFNSRRELDAEQAKRAVLYAFRWLGMHGYNGDWAPKLSITESAKYSIARTIIQAVGRICRTNRKSKRIYVFAADELCSSLDKQMFEDMGLQYNPEFKALIELFEDGSGCKEENRNAWNDAVLNVSRVRINALLNNIQNGPTKKNMESWEGLREVSLRNDTTNPHNPYVTDFYCKFENPKRRYWYTQSEDYKYTQIFDKPEPGAIEVSAEAARLDQLMKIPGLRACFEEKKWATDWVESRYLMSPIMFNNIYKGALGEVAGRFIFESVGLTLSPITEALHFEKFDYILTSHGTGDVFVDFKLWKPMTDFNNAEMLERITEKMRVVGARKVIVANILDDGNGRNEPKIWPLGDDVEQGGIFVLPSLITPDKLVDREVMGRVLEWVND